MSNSINQRRRGSGGDEKNEIAMAQRIMHYSVEAGKKTPTIRNVNQSNTSKMAKRFQVKIEVFSQIRIRYTEAARLNMIRKETLSLTASLMGLSIHMGQAPKSRNRNRIQQKKIKRLLFVKMLLLSLLMLRSSSTSSRSRK